MEKLKSIIIVAVFLLGFTSCEESYLDTAPTSSASTTTVFSTTENAQTAVNGLAKLMTKQYLNWSGHNGEGTIKVQYGEFPSNDFSVNLPGWATVINMNYMENNTSGYDYYPWFYYYKIIGNANAIIANVDNSVGLDKDKKSIKAQALSFRAYSYFMLSQLYCQRWSDSNNGASDGLVLRIDESTSSMPLSTLSEVYDQIYKDLDDAIKYFKESGYERDEDEFYLPNINVAYSIYSRAALTREDWATAASMGEEAIKNYPLMSNDEYKAGFSNPTSEWIWGCYGGAEENLYYWSYQAWMAYNSNASMCRNYPKCISKELFEQIPNEDIRKSLFLDPTGYEYDEDNGKYAKNSEMDAHARSLYKDLYSTSVIYAYMSFKIKANDLPGVGNLNIFRSGEMYLNIAEAYYHLDNPSEAQKYLVDLNILRNPSYTCTLTGDDLLAEIKKYRRFELWGEGFNWFDFKRWGDTIKRKSFAKGGNFVTDLAKTIAPSDAHNWVWVIPAKETDYNKLIN